MGLWDRAHMASINDDVFNVGLCQCLIQMAPRDFELMLVLKEGGDNREVVVAAK
jgi:hypothetical protein